MIYIEELQSFVDFEMLDPNQLIGFIIEDFDVRDYAGPIVNQVQLTRDAESSGFETGDILENLRIPLFLMLLGVLVIAVLLLIKVAVPRLKNRVRDILLT
jgi:hypothetical protein